MEVPLRAVRYVTGEVAESDLDIVAAQLADVDLVGVGVTADVEVAADSVAASLVAECISEPDTLTVMSTVGAGRTGAVLGSVVDGFLARGCSPALLVGPECELDRLEPTGRLVIPLDGSDVAESVLPLIGPWVTAFDLTPQVVSVIDPDATPRAAVGDLPPESAMVRAAAARLEDMLGVEVDYEVLHHAKPARALVDWADEAALIALSTHGRTGLARLVAGSVAMQVIRRVHCPVLLHRSASVT